MLITIATKGGFANLIDNNTTIDTSKLPAKQVKLAKKLFSPTSLRALRDKQENSEPPLTMSDACELEITINNNPKHEDKVFVIQEHLLPPDLLDLIDEVAAN